PGLLHRGMRGRALQGLGVPPGQPPPGRLRRRPQLLDRPRLALPGGDQPPLRLARLLATVLPAVTIVSVPPPRGGRADLPVVRGGGCGEGGRARRALLRSSARGGRADLRVV